MQVFNDFIILARDFSVDDRDQMLSIFKIIDKFNFGLDPENYQKFQDEAKKGPVTMPAGYAMTSSWRLEKPAKKELRCNVIAEVFDPEGQKIGESKNEIVFAVGLDRVRLSGNVEGLPITTNGYYTVKQTLIDETTKKNLAEGEARYQVNVELQETPTTPQG